MYMPNRPRFPPSGVGQGIEAAARGGRDPGGEIAFDARSHPFDIDADRVSSSHGAQHDIVRVRKTELERPVHQGRLAPWLATERQLVGGDIQIARQHGPEHAVGEHVPSAGCIVPVALGGGPLTGIEKALQGRKVAVAVVQPRQPQVHVAARERGVRRPVSASHRRGAVH